VIAAFANTNQNYSKKLRA